MSSLWLDDQRGYLVDWMTQRWVELTGSEIDLHGFAWLAGPTGPTHRIGSDFFHLFAKEQGLAVETPRSSAGLMESFSALAGPGFQPERIQQEIHDFYERTSEFELDVWSEWFGPFRPFGELLSRVFSQRLEQLNVPLSPLSTSRGLSNSIVRLIDPHSGQVVRTGWVRENIGSSETVYVGDYSIASIPGHPSPCVKVVFPLPNGSATVLMRPSAAADGSLKLESVGKSIGDPGFYFLLRGVGSSAWVRYVQNFRETIHVYQSNGELHTDHAFELWRRPVLRLHYRMRRRAQLDQRGPELSAE